jgi:threonine/homoserine/homoserine lactone efflux protein
VIAVDNPQFIASWFARNRAWLVTQRYAMGAVLAGLAVRLALEERREG